ncbi:MAG: SRPBCC family protein [Kineosporiaceae bacterium]|nr:SRPBCC family protein [Aeromicrobium sp.]
MQIRRTVVVDRPVGPVFDYLSDFANTTYWDPGTVSTTRSSGEGGIGTTYANTSKFAGRETELTYTVTEFEPNQKITLVGKNKTVTATDEMSFQQVGTGTRVDYVASFEFAGVIKLLAPLMSPAMKKLGDEAEQGMRSALERL